MKYLAYPFILFLYGICILSCDDESGENDAQQTFATVETFAGAELGLKDGPRTDAEFNSPSKIALSSSGDIYVIDQVGRALRKISSSGNVKTIFASYSKDIVALVVADDGTVFVAGASWIGRVRGDGSIEIIADGYQMPPESTFYPLTSMAILPNGSLLLFETGNYRVINISTSGEVIAVLCSHPMGYQGGDRNGKLEDAYFNQVYDMYVTENKEILFTDWLYHDVRKISVDTIVTTVAGRDYGFPFSFPKAIAATSDGMLYLIENHRIVKIDQSGNIGSFAGNVVGYVDAIGASAQFFGPSDMVITPDEHTMYVTDSYNNRIRRIIF